ncbi:MULTISPECIES: acyl-CoA dehydrogenase family protein [Amycolatopsis]|uniref:Acyl-CoA dehydrogenase n=1 Tax=Amycolatopsis bullii TaxID=941987 RepID=A0ABQ3KD32_9PSEU|nr:acyl-CoA dehydrogenase [Amycolatopsis bullii]GHG14359.1 acyl-CoA dehydrogenase [Amycolatopsis bullii]
MTALPAGILPAAVDGRLLWARLGLADLLRTAYHDGDPSCGVDAIGLRELLTAVDSAAPVGTTLAVCVQLATALPLLTTGGREARSVLADALAGDTVVALGATDERGGSNLTAMGTELHLGDDAVVVHGTKRWITNATHCDHILVLARHRPGSHFTNFTWVLVPADAPGVHVEPADTDLFAGSGTGHVRLDHVQLGRENLVGGPGRGLLNFAAHIAVERLAGALWGVALCTRVLAGTRRALTSAGRESPWRHDTVRQRFATCLVLTRQLRALTDELASRVTDQYDTTSAAMLKATAAMTVETVTRECAHLQGADGFARSGAQALSAQAALFGIGGGTTEVVLSIVSDAADAVIEELMT